MVDGTQVKHPGFYPPNLAGNGVESSQVRAFPLVTIPHQSKEPWVHRSAGPEIEIRVERRQEKFKLKDLPDAES